MKFLFKEDKKSTIVKIVLTIFIYAIIISIFRAGLDYQKLVPFKKQEPQEKVVTYEYTIKYLGQEKDLEFNEKKSLDQILDSYFDKEIEITGLVGGSRIDSIKNRTKFEIKINGKNINPKLIEETTVSDKSIIEVSF